MCFRRSEYAILHLRLFPCFKMLKYCSLQVKASNAGGVATSGLEMSQNSLRLNWTREEVDSKLKQIMIDIHTSCVQYGMDDDYIDYVKGANIAGFVKVDDGMIDKRVSIIFR